MKKLVIIVILAVLLVGLVPLGLNDTNIAVADTSISDHKIIASRIETSKEP